MKHHQIIISGAGYVGLLTALSLLHSNFNCIIIESQNLESISSQDDGRSFALSAKTINLLKKLNIFEKVGQYMQPINSVFCFEDKELPTFLMKETELLGGMISAHKLKLILIDELKRFPNFQLIDNFLWKDILYDFYNKKSYILSGNKIDGNTLSTDLIISTEGKNSKMIDYFHLKQFTHDYKQEATIFNIEHELPHNGTAIEKFFPSSTIAILPLLPSPERKNHSAIVWINNNLQSNYIKSLSNKDFISLFNEQIDHCLGRITLISKQKIFPLKLSFLKKYHLNNIIFLGDINHAIHPIAGQGFNLTIEDLNKIIELLEKYDLNSHLDTILKKFHHSRIIPNIKMIGFTHLLVKLFENNNIFLRKTRNLGIKVIDQLNTLL